MADQEFRLPMEPIGKGRPRASVATVNSGKQRTAKVARIYTPKKTKDWEDEAALRIRGQRKLPTILGAVRLRATFIFEVPKSVKLTRRAGKHHTQKPDIDNVIKACMDAVVKAGVIQDDTQVAVLESRKVWGAKHEINIIISELEEA